jgi:uncharacterized protein YcaQ
VSSVAWLRQQVLGWSLGVSGALPDVLARLEFVQSDPIRAPARAQDLILRHRVVDYRVGDLDRSYPELDIDEDWLYVYGFVARRLRTLLHPRRSRHSADGKYRPTGVAADVLAFVRKHGVTHPRDVNAHFGLDRVTNGWGGSSNATTMALESLRHYGLLRVARRESGIRLYEPMPPLGRPLAPDQRLSALVLIAARNLAPVPEPTLRRLVSYLGLKQATGRKVVPELVAAGALASQDVDGVRYLWPADLVPVDTEPAAEVRFMTPFDPVVWDRDRFEHLWGWPYRFEAYVPKAKRTMGYYAMPLLWRDRMIGWANCAQADGKTTVDLGFVDGRRPRERAFTTALGEETDKLTTFLTSQR